MIHKDNNFIYASFEDQVATNIVKFYVNWSHWKPQCALLSHHWKFEATCHCWLMMKITMLNLVDIAHSWIFVIVFYKYLGSLSSSWVWNIDTQLSSWKWMCLIWSLFSYFTWGELIVLKWIQIVHYKYLGIHVIKYIANYTSSNLPFTSSSRHTHHQVVKSLTLENYNFITH